MNINQLKLEVHDTYKKHEKKPPKFEPVNNDDVINKPYLDEKFKKTDISISYIEKHHNEFKSNNKENFLIEGAVRTTVYNLYDKGLFDNYDNADQVLDISFVEVNDGRRPDLEESK